MTTRQSIETGKALVSSHTYRNGINWYTGRMFAGSSLLALDQLSNDLNRKTSMRPTNGRGLLQCTKAFRRSLVIHRSFSRDTTVQPYRKVAVLLPPLRKIGILIAISCTKNLTRQKLREYYNIVHQLSDSINCHRGNRGR